MKKFKAYILFFVSGWRDIKVFGYPTPQKGDKFINVMVSIGDGSITDICQYNRGVWQQGGLSNYVYPKQIEVTLWKHIKRQRLFSTMYLTNK